MRISIACEYPFHVYLHRMSPAGWAQQENKVGGSTREAGWAQQWNKVGGITREAGWARQGNKVDGSTREAGFP